MDDGLAEVVDKIGGMILTLTGQPLTWSPLPCVLDRCDVWGYYGPSNQEYQQPDAHLYGNTELSYRAGCCR